MKSQWCCCRSRVSPEDDESDDEDAVSALEEIIEDVATTLKVLSDEDREKGTVTKKRTFKSLAQLVRSGAVAAKKRSTVKQKLTLKSVAKTTKMGAAVTGADRRKKKRTETKKSAMNSLFKVMRLGGGSNRPQAATPVKRKTDFKTVGRLAGTMNAPKKCSNKQKPVGLKFVAKMTRFAAPEEEQDEEICTCCQNLDDDPEDQPEVNSWTSKLKRDTFKRL